MKFNQKFNKEDLKRQVAERIERIELAVLNRLKYVGERFVKNARERANFTDRTGNLRNSIGYTIFKNGNPVYEQANNNTGGDAAKKVISEHALLFPRGLVLIVVAGMEYAAYVESKNFDVITASSLLAENELKEAINRMRGKIDLMK